jgi:type II secretion system protein N
MSRIILIILGLIVGVALLILLGVNMYVQSRGTQARIQQELSQRLGATLRIRRISVTPWWGLKLTGITIPQTQSGVSPDFLTAKTFRLRIRFSSLFSGHLVIKEISLVNPEIVWAQNGDGKWRLPSQAPEPVASLPKTAAEESPIAAPAPSKQKETVPEPSPSSPPPVVIQTERKATFTPEVEGVNVIRARFHFLDQKLKTVATFEDVDFRSSFRTSTDLRGNVTIAKASLRDRFFLQQFFSPLHYDAAELDLSQITARAGDGRINGRFTIQPQAEDSPFTVSIKFSDVQADKIVAEAGGTPGMVTGKLEGYLDATGKTADPNALAGTGEIVLRDGQLRQYSVLSALGQMLQIQELQQLRLDQAFVKYHIDPGIVTIDELIFRSENMRLSATGTVSFEGKLQLESQLAVNEKMRSQLFRAIRDNFKPIDDPGYAAINFQVSGTIGRPKTNLMDKLIGRDLRDLSSVITGLIGGGKSEKKKKTADEPAATPAPLPASPSPSLSP